MDQFEFGGAVAWRPTPELHRAQPAQRVHAGSTASASLDELMTRSTTDLEWFWRAVLDDLGIEFYEPYSRVIDLSPGIAQPAVVRRRSHEHRPQLPGEVGRHADGASPRTRAGKAKKEPLAR